jgi:hypothetical protein
MCSHHAELCDDHRDVVCRGRIISANQNKLKPQFTHNHLLNKCKALYERLLQKRNGNRYANQH